MLIDTGWDIFMLWPFGAFGGLEATLLYWYRTLLAELGAVYQPKGGGGGG